MKRKSERISITLPSALAKVLREMMQEEDLTASVLIADLIRQEYKRRNEGK